MWRVLYVYGLLHTVAPPCVFHSFIHEGSRVYRHDMTMTRRDMKNGEFGGSELPKKKNEGACADIYVGIGRLTRARISERDAMPWMDETRGGQRKGNKTRSRDYIYASRESNPIATTPPTTTRMYPSLSSSGPIKWNHNQESSLFQDVSPFSPEYDGRSTTTLSERIRELYLQFLWLPEV